MTGNRDSLTVTPGVLAMARAFSADVVEQIHDELAVPTESVEPAGVRQVPRHASEYAGVPAQLRARYVAVQAKFSASIKEYARSSVDFDWAARAVIQDEFAEVCAQIRDALCAKDSILSGFASIAGEYWRDAARSSRRLAEKRAGGPR